MEKHDFVENRGTAEEMLFELASPLFWPVLTEDDLNVLDCTISISKSRHLGAIGKPKTRGSRRLIKIGSDLMDLLEATRMPWHTENSPVFYNKFGDPLDANQWARTTGARNLMI